DVFELAKPTVDLEPAQDPLPGQLAHDRTRPGHAERELVEELPLRESRFPTRELRHALRKRVRSAKADVSDMAKAVGAHVGQVHGGGEGAKRVVGAYVGGRLLTADVLFASREGKHETAAALCVMRRTHQ